MVRPVGLRTEILVNIALLVAAALLFVSFLLLRLTERELLEERLRHLRNIMDVFSRSGPLDQTSTRHINTMQGLIPSDLGIISLILVDDNLVPLGSVMHMDAGDQGELKKVRIEREGSTKIDYRSNWLPLSDGGENVAVVTVPVIDRQQVVAVLQGRFSLADIRQRIVLAQKVVLIYVVLYGGVLLFFGIYLLGRTVVVPIRRLMTASSRVAAGDLEQPLDLMDGPREIKELCDSFNTMQESLKKSREETRDTINSLEAANQSLQSTRNELIRAERIASVGHLAAGMAHEIGNPLGAVIGYLELLKRDETSSMKRDLVERAGIEAARIDRLVKDLLEYAAPAKNSSEEPLDPAAVFVETRNLLLNQGVFEGFRLVDLLPESLPYVQINRHRLIQVLVNFLLNARDASSAGGEICLAGGVKGEMVWLSVGDRGEGVPQEIISHLFDPFFTTKPPGKGCGLGLSVCHRIATDAGGRIEVRSSVGEGSEFVLWLKKVADDED